MKYVTKLGAHGLAVAAAFAVALAVLVSVSSTPTAEAADVNLPEGTGSVDAAPGDTVQVRVNGALAQVSITGTDDGVGGSFVANGGQSINCSDNATCDKHRVTATPPAHVDDVIMVELKIDADSGEGYILISVEGIGAGTNTAQVTKVINVSKETLVGSLTIKASPKTIAAADGTSTLTINVKNASANTEGMNDQDVSVVTTLGSIECVSGTETQACEATTANSSGIAGVDDGTPGYATVTLNGKGVEGQAVVTARLGTLTATATVTLFGGPKNLTAEPQQGSVEIGGSVFVVLTVTDGAGNPVRGQVITPVSSKEVVGPGEDAVPVVTSRDTDTDAANGIGYNVDFIHPRDSKQNLPACGDDKDPVTDTSANPPTTEDFATNGTDDAGKCVVQVTATEASGTVKAATRGMHTLNFAIDSLKASATIEVAGKPASISTDAPDPVEPTSVTEITVSVFDDEDVLVGITSVKVRKIGGDGLIEDHGEDGSEMTSNGQSKFTFIAPSRAGSSEILITAGDVNHRLTLNIGEAMPEPPMPDEEEAMPEGDALSFLSPSIASFSGGSIAELAAAAEAACPGGAIFWPQASDGSWPAGYSTTAIAIANTPFEAAWAGGIPATAVFFTECEADAMGDEG